LINLTNQEVRCLIPRTTNINPGWKNIQIKKIGRFSANLWEQIDLPLSTARGLLFSTANIGPYFSRNQVVAIHDPSVFAVPFTYSLPFQLKYRTILNKVGKTALKIITFSEFSRRELQHWCKIPEEKIAVIYEGREHILSQPADETIFSRLGIGEHPFFLAVGSNSLHKNFAAAAHAFENAQFTNVDFVVTGGDFPKVFKASKDTLSSSFRKTGYISDGELRALYNRAVGLVYPSLYEGFGLPPLEAMTCGCPVICSNAASLPEVCGDAAVYCNPNDINEISNQMKRLVSEPGLRTQLREKGIIQAGKFSWRSAAEKTWDVLVAAQNYLSK
jgi:glycosyltransferase involved in cell wall biosynthesis